MDQTQDKRLHVVFWTVFLIVFVGVFVAANWTTYTHQAMNFNEASARVGGGVFGGCCWGLLSALIAERTCARRIQHKPTAAR